MIDFKYIDFKDKEWIDKCVQASDFQGCEYIFTSFYIWRTIYHIHVANVDGMCCLRAGYDGNYKYTFPIGKGDTKKGIESLMRDAKERGHTFVLRGIMKEQMQMMKEWFPDLFDYELQRDESDYIYTVEKLSKLAGKKLHGKRNHIRRFMDSEDWSYEDISQENIELCMKMNEEWNGKYVTTDDESLRMESEAVKETLAQYFQLGLKGGLLKREGKVVAYTIGEPLNSNTYVIHIEKAFHEIQGAYPMINQQFVLHNCQQYKYVNREEDTGDEGLRKAKLSYYPDILLDKYNAKIKGEK